jgi:hypothetical protein
VWTISNIPSSQNHFGRASEKAVFIRCYHAVSHDLDVVLLLNRQRENKIAVDHPLPLSKRLAEVGNQKSFRRMLALRRRVAYFCAP